MFNFACVTGLTGFQTTMLEGVIRSLEHCYGLKPDGFLAFLCHQKPPKALVGPSTVAIRVCTGSAFIGGLGFMLLLCKSAEECLTGIRGVSPV